MQDGIILVLMLILDWEIMWQQWIMPKKHVRWIREIRNFNSITSNYSMVVRRVRSVEVLQEDRSAVAMVAVTAAMVVTEAMEEVPVEPVICVVICGVQILYVSVWEEIFVDASNQTHKLAVMAVMAALSTVLTVLGTVISVNTVFFTAAAAFLAGIIVTCYGKRAGVLFFAVCAVLDFLVNPDKLHVILYLCLAGYTVLSELTYGVLKIRENKKKERVHRVIRFVFFAVIYSPLILFLPRLVISENIIKKSGLLPVMIVGGIVGWIVYDAAYAAFKKMVRQYAGKLLF